MNNSFATGPTITLVRDSAAPLMTVSGLTKAFGPVIANDDLSFTIHAGEVHVLMGENGAGKSTLVKSLYGVHRPDAGEIRLNGEPVEFRSPADARACGIGMVFQDMRLIPALTVWENIALHLNGTAHVLPRRDLKRRIAELGEEYGLVVDPSRRVTSLSIGEWQRVELLKVLMSGVRVLVLDEPTSVLTPREVEGLFRVLDRLRSEGVGIVLITHKLREVRTIADRVTVLRGGRAVMVDEEPARFTDDELIEAMVGVAVARDNSLSRRPHGELLVRLENVSIDRYSGATGLDGVSLDIYRGEILGIAGVAGSGQDALTDLLTGMATPSKGAVSINGETGPLDPARCRASGIVEVSPDPVRQFVIPGLSVGEHVDLWNLTSEGIRRPAADDLAERDGNANLMVASADRQLSVLSGGNVQRVVLTLALTSPADLIVASYPTRGLDILTTRRTRNLIRDRRNSGAGVVLVSEDLDELLELSDRIAVLHDGAVIGSMDAGSASRQGLGELMAGKVAA